MSSSAILKGFNNHISEFLEDICQVFPEDPKINTAKNLLFTIKKANPKLLIRIWHKYITLKYTDEIEKEEISFFIDKDYSTDVSNLNDSSEVVDSINQLRGPIKNMGEENQQKCMKYIKNLSNLTKIYFKEE